MKSANTCFAGLSVAVAVLTLAACTGSSDPAARPSSSRSGSTSGSTSSAASPAAANAAASQYRSALATWTGKLSKDITGAAKFGSEIPVTASETAKQAKAEGVACSAGKDAASLAAHPPSLGAVSDGTSPSYSAARSTAAKAAALTTALRTQVRQYTGYCPIYVRATKANIKSAALLAEWGKKYQYKGNFSYAIGGRIYICDNGPCLIPDRSKYKTAAAVYLKATSAAHVTFPEDAPFPGPFWARTWKDLKSELADDQQAQRKYAAAIVSYYTRSTQFTDAQPRINAAQVALDAVNSKYLKRAVKDLHNTNEYSAAQIKAFKSEIAKHRYTTAVDFFGKIEMVRIGKVATAQAKSLSALG